MPFTVAETPAIVSPRGDPFESALEGASWEPVIVIIMPGANALACDAAFAALAIFVVEDAPTTSTTGTLIYAGVVFAELTTNVAL
jgi:hypothetical protein